MIVAWIASAALPAGAQDAAEIVRATIDNWRGKSSYGEMTMTIHRPSWERTMSMRAWTQGSKKSLVRITAPKKDAGNGTLMVDNNMWSYAPKVNRVIKVPSSMMGQSWMGSDFSNKDVSRADDIVDAELGPLVVGVLLRHALSKGNGAATHFTDLQRAKRRPGGCPGEDASLVGDR
jgi:hypothetical protein